MGHGGDSPISASELYSPNLLEKVKEFWNTFDSRYLKGDPEVTRLYLSCNLMKVNPVPNRPPMFNLDWMFFVLKDRMQADPLNYEQSLTTEMLTYKNGIIELANDQRGIINNNLRDLSEIRQAFELFGQGVLYDERRGSGHQMDGRFPRDLVGYRRWHGFIRAIVSIGEDPDFWLELDRYLLIAYLLQSKLTPIATKQNNPYIDKETLVDYRSSCLSLDSKNLDEAFKYFFS